ncbi:MAG: hypothetical protein HZC54_20830 [Verrucomicrobia bacterium]|nr:hypothetical protein [Verrucomicrobiota bacterium]
MMTARLVVAGVVIGLLGVCPPVWAQGRNLTQPYEQKRTVGIITPGSLYKNQTFNQNLPGTLNKPGQLGNRRASTAPQNVSTTQPLYKPVTVNVPQQPSPFSTAPKTATPMPSPFASVFTPSQPAQQTPPPPPPLYNMSMGQQPAAQPPPPYSVALPAAPLSTPMPQAAYSITPQFTAVSPLSPGGLPNTAVTTPARQPFYSMGQQVTAPQPLRPSMPQPGAASTPLQPPAMTGPQSLPAPQSTTMPPASSATSTPLVTPLVTPLNMPLNTPLNTQLQTPFYVPQTPFAAPQPPPQR